MEIDMWISGFNMPGYLCDVEPSEHEDWTDARNSLVWWLEQAYDQEDDLIGNEILKYIALLERSDEPQEVGFNVANYHWFINQINGD
jgi:hypothetical protein